MARKLSLTYDKSGHPPGKRRVVCRPHVVFFGRYEFVIQVSFATCTGTCVRCRYLLYLDNRCSIHRSDFHLARLWCLDHHAM
jgi:hypothetical protein